MIGYYLDWLSAHLRMQRILSSEPEIMQVFGYMPVVSFDTWLEMVEWRQAT